MPRPEVTLYAARLPPPKLELVEAEIRERKRERERPLGTVLTPLNGECNPPTRNHRGLRVLRTCVNERAMSIRHEIVFPLPPPSTIVDDQHRGMAACMHDIEKAILSLCHSMQMNMVAENGEVRFECETLVDRGFQKRKCEEDKTE